LYVKMKRKLRQKKRKRRFSRKQQNNHTSSSTLSLSRSRSQSSSYVRLSKSYSSKIFAALRSLDRASVMQAQQLMTHFINGIFQRSANDAINISYNQQYPSSPLYYLFNIRLTHNQTIGRVIATNQPPYY
uniref:Ovule protein n=1 Tax=Brugia timori TaxID=42155 RepID=A0A0R3QDY6_9BILA